MNTETVNGASSKSTRTNSVTKILVGKLDEASVREWAKKEGLAVGEDESVEQVATSLWALWQKRRDEKGVTLYKCEPKDGGCGGQMPNEEGACPFCAVDPEAAKAPPAATAKETKEAAPLAEPEAPAPIAEGTSFTEGSFPEPAASTTDVGTNQVEARAPKAKKEKAERTAKAAVKPIPPKMEPTTPVVQAIVVRDDTMPASQVLTEADLDAAVEEIRQARKDSQNSWFREGLGLHRIFKQELWKLRKGAPHKAFEAFIAKELGVTPGYAWKRVTFSRAYELLTEKQALAIGMTNFQLMSNAPAEDQPKFFQEALAKLERGEVVKAKDTRSKVVAANKAKGKIATKQSKTGTRALGGGRKKEFVRIAISEYLHKETLKVMETPEGDAKPERAEVPPAVAKWFEKVQPYAERESLDGEVREVFSFVVKDGKLGLISNKSRVIDEEDAE